MAKIVVNNIKRYYQEILIFSTFGLLTLIATYPIIFRMSVSVYGPLFGTDNLGAIWFNWWHKYAWLHHISPKFISVQASPFGIDMSHSPFNPLLEFFDKWTSILTNEIFAFNLNLLLSFFLSAVFMYCLVYYFTRNRLAGIISGIIYSFCPYHFVRAWEHLGLANIQWIPLYILALLRLNEKRRYKDAILCGLAFWLVISFDYSYGYISTILTLGFVLFLLTYRWRLRVKMLVGAKWTMLKEEMRPTWQTLKMVGIAILITLIITLPTLYPIFKTILFVPKSESVAYVYVRPFRNLFSQSARPLSYLLPSIEHPIFGKWVEPFVGSIFYGRSHREQTLYLGYIPLILAFVAYRRWRGQRKRAKNQLATEHSWPSLGQSRYDFIVGFFVFSALLGWLFSLPPYWRIGNFKIYFPAFFMYKLLPMFRAYARFGIVLIASVSALAGIGMVYVLHETNNKKRIAILSMVISLILFEFTNIPPFRVTDISNPPPVYRWLSQQTGDFAVAEYPLGSVGTHKDYLFWQRIHKKRLINGALPGTHAYKVKQKINKISDPETPGILSYLGAKYVVVHIDRYLTGEDSEAQDIVGQAPDLNRQDGLELVKKFGNVEVYEVKAEPIKPRVD